MSATEQYRDLPGLVRRLVDDYLSAKKEIESLRQERDGLRNTNHALAARLDELCRVRNERDGLRADLQKIKADAVREACKYAAQKALDEGFYTIDSNDILQYAKNIEAMAKEQGDGN